LPHNPYPPGSPRARAWEAAKAPEEQLELQALLHEAAKRRTAVSARKEEGTDAEPAGQDIT
jgi:hypothetical protein